MNYNQNKNDDNQNIINKQMNNGSNHNIANISDSQFYNNLTHYKTLCYRGKGVPFFFVNEGWSKNIACLVITNCLFMLVLIIFWVKSRDSKQFDINERNTYMIVGFSSIVITNLMYLLTQFMNPGIRNLTTIQASQYEQLKKIYCQKCEGYRTNNIEHCEDCGVCVQGLDHHCGFFNKCIAGYQKFAFYGLLLSAFISFCLLLVALSSNITSQ